MTMEHNNWWQEAFGAEYGAAFEHFYNQEKTERETTFLRRYAGMTAGQQVLDAPCGAGRHALALAALGCEVTALDYSSDLLALLRDKAGSDGVKVSVVQGDVRDFDLSKRFDRIVTLGNSFGYFSDEDNRRFMENVARHLENDGRFVLDLPNVPGLLRQPLGTSDLKFPDGRIRTEAYDFNSKTRRLRVRWEIEALGRTKTTEGELRLYEPEEIAGLLSACGMAVEAAYGDFNGGEVDIESPRYVIVAAKRNASP